jgi:hypothetical protein
MHGCRELILRREPIRDGGCNEALFRELLAAGVPPFALAGAKSAAMNAEHGWKRSFAILGAGQVELQVLVIGIGVLDARLEDDLSGLEQASQGKEQQ